MTRHPSNHGLPRSGHHALHEAWATGASEPPGQHRSSATANGTHRTSLSPRDATSSVRHRKGPANGGKERGGASSRDGGRIEATPSTPSGTGCGARGTRLTSRSPRTPLDHALGSSMVPAQPTAQGLQSSHMLLYLVIVIGRRALAPVGPMNRDPGRRTP